MTFQDVETARKTYWDKFKSRLLIDVIISVIIGAIITMIIGANIPTSSHELIFHYITIVMTAFFLLSNIVFFLTRKEFAAYRKAYKEYFVEQNLQKIFTDITYFHESGLDSRILEATGMINTGDRYNSNDLTIAKYKNIGFTQADSHIQVISTDSEGGISYETIFKGRIMIFQFPKKFNFKLELVGKNFRAYKVPEKDATTGRKMNEISTESNEFNHTFKIYGQDGFETFYILDPAMIVKIQTIAERYNDKILFGFLDNQMLIAIDGVMDSFEPSSWIAKPIDEKTEMVEVATEAKDIADFVDELSLTPIFRKNRQP